MDNWQDGGFGIYLHWPFCQSKCPYCDFNSHVTARVDETRWATAFESEIARIAGLVPGRVVQSIYFGGGTPSLMSPDLVGGILNDIRASWPLANDCEITLEANPGSVEVGRFGGFRDAGINRISMGLQAMNDADLRRLGRMHTAVEAFQAIDIARYWFDRVSFDLIYARQDQTVDDWKSELGQALRMGMDHLSLYQLTIEDGTVFGERFAKGQLRGLPGEDTSVAMYEITQEMCEAKGLAAYEVSNHARPGQESRHNLLYWRGGDYAGIGPGAHGRLTVGGARSATAGHRIPQQWLTAVEAKGAGDEATDILAPGEVASEYLMMGLRLREGIDIDRFQAMGGGWRAPAAAELVEHGMVEIADNTLRTTTAGRLVLNEVLRRLLA